MNTERLVQIGIATFATLSTALLSMGQRDTHLPILVLLSAVVSLYVTDIRGWVRINRTAANLAATVAAAVSGWGLLRLDSESLLMAAAYLLVYLQIVLLFQAKTTRTYWELAMTGLLQVVVASALNDGFLFGMLLLIYIVVGMATLSVFFVHREKQRYGGEVVEPLNVQLRQRKGEFSGRTGWPLAHQPAEFKGAVAGELSRSVSGWTITRSVAVIFAGSLAFTIILFFLVPRVGRSTIRSMPSSPRRVVGFNSDVELGELGTAVENPEEVMIVEFTDPDTRTRISIAGEPLFRGSVLVRYRNGRWSKPTDVQSDGDLNLASSSRLGAKMRPAYVLQQITLEPLSEPIICCIHPAFAPRYSEQDLEGISYHRFNEEVFRSETLQRRKISIDLVTTGIWQRKQFPIVPQQRRLNESDRKDLLYVSPGLTGLEQEASRVLQEANLSAENAAESAKALESYLRDSGRFSYSLTPPVRDRSVDPIEDFVTNNPVGHCEYFSSALTLMLRSQGIPARMVVGFKGGDFNPLGSFYQVRQLHAHTWVEAYLPRGQVPEFPPGHPLFGDRNWGAWMILDPTPGNLGSSSIAGTSRLQSLRQVTDYLRRLWSSHVVGLTSTRQQSDIYRPLAERVRWLARIVFDRQTWRNYFRNVANLFRGNVDWQSGAAASLLCLAAVVLFRLLRGCWRTMRKVWIQLGSWRADRRRKSAEITFYRKFERLAKSRGFRRQPGQTAREFAQHFERTAGLSPSLASVPMEIVDSFYQVRFGETALAPERLLLLDQQLGELRDSMGNGTSNLSPAS